MSGTMTIIGQPSCAFSTGFLTFLTILFPFFGLSNGCHMVSELLRLLPQPFLGTLTHNPSKVLLSSVVEFILPLFSQKRLFTSLVNMF